MSLRMRFARVAEHLRQRQFLRYLLVGGFNTLSAYALYALLLAAGMDYALANLFSLVISILVSFKMQGRLVFGDPRNQRIWRFVLVWAVIYAANLWLLSALVGWGLNAYLAGALGLPFTTLCSYVAQKYFVFDAGAAAASKTEATDTAAVPAEREALR